MFSGRTVLSGLLTGISWILSDEGEQQEGQDQELDTFFGASSSGSASSSPQSSSSDELTLEKKLLSHGSENPPKW